jgi:SAM-dependent methyltransferase
MYTATAEYYDLIYSTIKDYASEVAQLTSLLRRHNPACTSVLDVACGSGEHAWRLAAEGFRVDGLDLDPAFLAIARRKHPAGQFFNADMRDFHLPSRYDAVLCLFSSIGYLKTLDRVADALRCFREHLTPGGVILVEPWFPPGGLDATRVTTVVGEANGVRVSRTARAHIDGRVSRVFFDYEISGAGGTRHASEVHELGLFTVEEQLSAFRDAGLDVEHDPKGLMDRGLFVATVMNRRAG